MSLAQLRGEDPLNHESGVTELSTPYAAPEFGVPVRYYPDVKASAGHGCPPVDEATVTMLNIAKEVLERKGVNINHAALLQASGDSMKGTIDDGDMMLVDTSDTQLVDGRVYAVSADNNVLVKRVQWIPNGIKLISDNPAYDSITVLNEDQEEKARIVGRVIINWHVVTMI